MQYIADLHLHSHFSRATARNLNLESLYQWALVKGINVVGTGDFTHPKWFSELQEKLVPDGNGFFRLKNPPKEPPLPGIKTKEIELRFCLSVEISSIYKWNGKVRKNHNIVFAPDFETAAKINAKLSRIGNIASDGRPILGLPSRDLLEIALETSPDAYLIPAHIWTPWFSMLGSKSGYDSVKECFRDLTHHIFALETGLSSDPEMNWLVSELDSYSLVSNSDAHSPQKLGREATLFDTGFNYFEMFNALKTTKGFNGTLEFFPEEGKYHLDGHRNCKVRMEPEQTIENKGICPQCGGPVTVGVLNRVVTLADRQKPLKPPDSPGYRHIIPLPEIISEITGSPPASRKTLKMFTDAITCAGNELSLLNDMPVDEISKKINPVLGEAIKRMRNNEVKPETGYDGEFGKIKMFSEGEVEALFGQNFLFGPDSESRSRKKILQKSQQTQETVAGEEKSEYRKKNTSLNENQKKVLETGGTVLVIAGPGTGKTHTLVHWISHYIRHKGINPAAVLALTFTNKAADELKERLKSSLGSQADKITAGTFHSVCYKILKEADPEITTVFDRENRVNALRILFCDKSKDKIGELADYIPRYYETGIVPDEKIGGYDLKRVVSDYDNFLSKNRAIDLSGMISRVNTIFDSDKIFKKQITAKYRCLAVDELQDINPEQYRFILHFKEAPHIFAIGDPDQSIYSFRGSDVGLISRFRDEFVAKEIFLEDNYRSGEEILNSAYQVIKNNCDFDRIKLKTTCKTGEIIHWVKCADQTAEAGFIAGEIEKLVGGFRNLSSSFVTQGRRDAFGLSDIAVLFRLRRIGEFLTDFLKNDGIPLRFGDNTNYLLSYPYSIIKDIFNVLLNPRDFTSVYSICSKHLRIKENEIINIITGIEKNGMDVIANDYVYDNHYPPTFLQMVNLLKMLPSGMERGGVINGINMILENLFTEGDSNTAEQVKRESILELAASCGSDWQLFLKKATLDSYTDVGRYKSDAVNLLTFHAAKGLEFPVIFIVGAEEGITPYLRRGSTIEEERRLFYVALTRAKERVIITSSKQRFSGDEMKTTEPSRFISEIPEEYLQKREENVKEAGPKQLRLF
ncbi:MAG: UvrD-helicase domain-containing protein [Bacteroidetes bacterium]|nr:UvrD-helicase domain-containing protein [Bacteroidota bacterium]